MANDEKAENELREILNSATELHTQTQDLLTDCGSGKASPKPHLPNFTETFKDLKAKHRSVVKPASLNERGTSKSAAPPPRSDPTRITTGNHLKRLGAYQLQGIGSADEAAERFYSLTADTHGGKVPHGKRGGSYVSKGGKRIRKF
jgi:hypothetical protein